jgi:hypothetical protein
LPFDKSQPVASGAPSSGFQVPPQLHSKNRQKRCRFPNPSPILRVLGNMEAPTMPRGTLSQLERRFSVHGRDETPSRSKRVEAISFEDAALAFFDAYHPDSEGAEVSLMIEDCETGERQCFRVDLASGDAAPCD